MVRVYDTQMQDTFRGDWKTNLLDFWNGRGRGLEITEVPQGPPRYGSGLLTVRLTKLVKMTPSLCWLQELAHLSDIIQRSNQMKRSDTAWFKGWAHLFGRDGVQAVSMARLTTIFYTTAWEMIQKFFSACNIIAWSRSTCVWSGLSWFTCCFYT